MSINKHGSLITLGIQYALNTQFSFLLYAVDFKSELVKIVHGGN
jgi:hypothetical protein